MFNFFSVGFWLMASVPIAITLIVGFIGLKMMVRFIEALKEPRVKSQKRLHFKSDHPEVEKPKKLYGRITAVKVNGRAHWQR